MSTFFWHSKNKQAGHLLLQDGPELKNQIIQGATIMTREEITSLTKPEMNNILGNKYTHGKLANIRREDLI